MSYLYAPSTNLSFSRPGINSSLCFYHVISNTELELSIYFSLILLSLATASQLRFHLLWKSSSDSPNTSQTGLSLCFPRALGFTPPTSQHFSFFVCLIICTHCNINPTRKEPSFLLVWLCLFTVSF